MNCRLCENEKELRNSHIIPETFYTHLYDEKHRALPIHLDNRELKIIQKGIREQLLCDDCEQKFSKWEGLLKKDLVDIGKLESNFLEISTIGKGFIKVGKIRYKEFKLAVLSILWRMSISSRSHFKAYDLGPYEEKIRKTLLDEVVPLEKQYPISLSRYELQGNFSPDLLLLYPPGRFQNKFVTQKFAIYGHCFTIFVNDKFFPAININIFLREFGQLFIDTQCLTDLASPKSVMSRLLDKDVNKIFDGKMEWKR